MATQFHTKTRYLNIFDGNNGVYQPLLQVYEFLVFDKLRWVFSEDMLDSVDDSFQLGGPNLLQLVEQSAELDKLFLKFVAIR
ncbi:hypothetical protein N7533_011030 [Penicillium manginii]|uniref:uncharacterized protein n=1 Tax=Penicillium manginii TaxID=203109 RepID=UPI002546CC6A|nr:uncharacterized protein N7533_011030 [Penicillium manginii]KAJ5741621.1 hypothetical protein N7533_011030 [Penicillium manginii]